MDKNNIEPGKHYAIREHPNDDLQHVKIVESVRSRKWRAEWIDPNPGLIDYVASRSYCITSPAEVRTRTLENVRELLDTHPALVNSTGLAMPYITVCVRATLA